MKSVLIVLELIPALIAAIKAIEEAVPGQGNGEQKLVMIRTILENIEGFSKEVWPTLERTIAIIVGAFNKLGVFKKG